MIDNIIVGDTLDFLTTVSDYPPADGWTLKFRLVPRVSGVAIAITAATSGTDYRVQVAPATTAGWAAGEYSWNSWVEKTGARQTVDSGQVTLLPDPAVTAVPLDNRSHAQIVLAAIEAVIEGRATKDQEEYTIGDRSLKRTPLSQLLDLRMQYKAEVRSEEREEAAKNGTGGNRVQWRL